VPLTALWANCHPAFWLGPVFTATYLISYQVSIFREKTAQTLKLRNRLALILAGQLVATLINPYGYRIYYSSLSLLLNPRMLRAIIEWKPLLGDYDLPVGTVPCFLAVVAVWVATLLWAGRRARLEHVLLFLLIALSTVFGRRNLIQFGPLGRAPLH
jgi:phosphoglycerol transferase MdoB-like AlkP superfamily enzyme